MANDAESGGVWVFKRGAPLPVPLPVLLKYVSTFASPVAQCCCEPTLYALFFSSGAGAVTNQSIDRICLQKLHASGEGRNKWRIKFKSG